MYVCHFSRDENGRMIILFSARAKVWGHDPQARNACLTGLSLFQMPEYLHLLVQFK